MIELKRGERCVLAAMSTEPEKWWHGLDIFEAAGFRAGTGYVSLFRLEQSALIESRWENPEGERPRRRVYKLTENGRRSAIEHHEARRKRPRRGAFGGILSPNPA